MSPERSRFLPQAPTFKEQGFNQVWSVTRGIAAPANLDKKAEATLTAALEKVIGSREHQEKAEKLSLEPLVIRGRCVPQVPQGQRTGNKETDEVVMQSRDIVVVHTSDVHVDHVHTAHIHGGDGAGASHACSTPPAISLPTWSCSQATPSIVTACRTRWSITPRR